MSERFKPSHVHKQMLRQQTKRAEAAEAALEQERAEKAELVAGLTVILPMAKGYAAEHNVGNNQKMVQEVEQFLSGHSSERHEAKEEVFKAVGIYVNVEEEFNAINASHPEEREWDIKRVQVNTALKQVRQLYREFAKLEQSNDQ